MRAFQVESLSFARTLARTLAITHPRNIAFNGVYQCDLKIGEWIAIIGCGGLGQFGIQYAKAMDLKVVGLEMKDTVLSAAKVSTASTGDVN